MKKFAFLVAITLVMGVAFAAAGADFAFHGDMNNRFLVYTNHNDWLNPDQQGVIHNGSVSDEYGELKYRFWTEIGDNDGNTKGVYAIEIGGVRFGRQGSGKGQGGSFSGDAVNVETRWAYFDFQLPFLESSARTRMGLQPFKVNSYLWQETAAGITFRAMPVDKVDYQLGWIRVVDNLARDDAGDNIKDVDNFLGRIDFLPTDGLKIGVFGLYTTGDASNAGTFESRDYEIKEMADIVDTELFNLGVDGSFKSGNFFASWDLIYQTGKIDNATFDDSEFSGVGPVTDDFDVSAYFVHADAGLKAGKAKFTYTFWYASGDDNPNDSDFNAYIAYDVDVDSSQTFFEGNYADDVTYFTERPYVLDKGFVMNKIAADYQWTGKLKVGAAAMYMMTAEDIKYFDNKGRKQSDDSLGVEINAYVKYKLFRNVELALNAGYLFSGDAMDAFEVDKIKDGNADEDIFVSSARVRYKF